MRHFACGNQTPFRHSCFCHSSKYLVVLIFESFEVDKKVLSSKTVENDNAVNDTTNSS